MLNYQRVNEIDHDLTMKSPSIHHSPLSAPDRSQKEPLRGKFKRTTHLAWTVGKYPEGHQPGENHYEPPLASIEEPAKLLGRILQNIHILLVQIKSNKQTFFESLNHESLQSRPNESRRKVSTNLKISKDRCPLQRI